MCLANSLCSRLMTVRGQTRRVYIERERSDGSYSARVLQPGTSNSVRGVVRENSLGVWRFTATNPENLV